MKSDEFITADLHLGHTGLLKHGLRDFESTEAMDKAIITNWNTTVSENAAVYILGDFSLSPKGKIIEYLKQLNGRKRLILGNHDRNIRGDVLHYFEWIKDYYESKTEDGTKVVMFHYPLVTWNKSHYGSIHCHGHCHGSLSPLPGKRLDVGIDTHPEFRPYSFAEIQERINQLEVGLFDHHKLRVH